MIPTITRSNRPRSVAHFAYFLDVTSNQGLVSNTMVVRKNGLKSHFYMNLPTLACVEPCVNAIGGEQLQSGFVQETASQRLSPLQGIGSNDAFWSLSVLGDHHC
jgi:hypothetical protein